MHLRSILAAMGFIAALAAPARATGVINYAPTIDYFPDIVIGDFENSSGANVFVFPNAINLDDVVLDDTTSRSAIVWSYWIKDGAYLLNGKQPIDLSVEDPVSPPADKRLDANLDPLGSNATPHMITFRDNLRSPISEVGGIGPYSDRYGSGGRTPRIIDSRAVTLFASDGTTFTPTTFFVYTGDNYTDQYSGCVPFLVIDDFTKIVPPGWEYTQNWSGTPGNSSGPQGLCIEARRFSGNDAKWTGPFRELTLLGNMAYEARLKVTTSENSAFRTPLWALDYQNYGKSGNSMVGHYEYGGEVFFLDNEGGANSPLSGVGPDEFRAWFMPIAMQTPQFSDRNTGFVQGALNLENDMSITLRILGITGYPTSADPSTICWQRLTIYARDLSDMVVDDPNVFSVDHFVDAKVTPNDPNAFIMDSLGAAAKATFNADGTVTIGPATNWDNKNAYVLFRPGDAVTNLTGSPDTACNRDNWPIDWIPNSLYYIEYMLSAPTEWDEVNQPDIIRVGYDTLTNEITSNHFAIPNMPELVNGAYTSTSLRGMSTPRFGPPQKYGCFFFTQKRSLTQINDGARWRPRLEILATDWITPNGRATNKGGIKVHSVSVKKVHFKR